MVAAAVLVLSPAVSLCASDAAPATATATAPFHFPCEWPVIWTGGRVAHAPTRVAQRLLGSVLDQGIEVDGVFGNKTKAAVEAFQKLANLPINGVLDSVTWPALVEQTGSVGPGSKPAIVEAVQDALTSQGLPTNISGLFDPTTQANVVTLQSTRGAASTSGQVDGQTWHLLASGCNSSLDTAAFWFDAGWPQGNLSLDTLACLKDAGFQFGTFECWREYTGWFDPCVQNVANAWAAGLTSVGVYMFPVRAADPATQAAQLLSNLSVNAVKFDAVMLDIEGSDWDNYTQAENQVFLTQLRQGLESGGAKVTVYCGTNWVSYFGPNFNTFSDLPVIYAHYDNVPSFYDWFDTPYGGWTAPAGKQFWDGSEGETICGTGALDWDWSPKPFW